MTATTGTRTCPSCGGPGEPFTVDDGRGFIRWQHTDGCRIGRTLARAAAPLDEFDVEWGNPPAPYAPGDHVREPSRRPALIVGTPS